MYVLRFVLNMVKNLETKFSCDIYDVTRITLYTVDATEYATAQIDATFHEGREKRRTVS